MEKKCKYCSAFTTLPTLLSRSRHLKQLELKNTLTMASGHLSARQLFCQLLLLGSASSFAPSECLRSTAAHHHRHRHNLPPSILHLGAAAKSARIPSSPADRDVSAIASVRSAIIKPRSATFPLIECEFPSLSALNKLGDGSLRSSMEAEDAIVAFVAKLVGGLSSPIPVLGPRVSVVTSTSASESLVEKIRKLVAGKGGGGGGGVYSLKGGSSIPEQGGKGGGGGKKEVFVFLTPSSQGDYRAARSIAESGRAVVIVNGSFKVRDRVCRRRPNYNSSRGARGKTEKR